jgi:hypothetical protein
MIEFRRRIRSGLRVWAWRHRAHRAEEDSQSRGTRLLRDWLTPQQLAQFDARGYFDVTGCHTGKRYRIRNGTAANVHEVDEFGGAGMGCCFVPEGCLVAGDVMLAQKIALETNELGTLAIANRFPPLFGWGFSGGTWPF